jgi:hypothetical protein
MFLLCKMMYSSRETYCRTVVHPLARALLWLSEFEVHGYCIRTIFKSIDRSRVQMVGKLGG